MSNSKTTDIKVVARLFLFFYDLILKSKWIYVFPGSIIRNNYEIKISCTYFTQRFTSIWVGTQAQFYIQLVYYYLYSCSIRCTFWNINSSVWANWAAQGNKEKQSLSFLSYFWGWFFQLLIGIKNLKLFKKYFSVCTKNLLKIKVRYFFSKLKPTVYKTGYSRWRRSIKKMPKQNNLAKILKVTSESKTYYHTQFEGQIRFAVWDTSPGWVPITLPCIKKCMYKCTYV